MTKIMEPHERYQLWYEKQEEAWQNTKCKHCNHCDRPSDNMWGDDFTEYFNVIAWCYVHSTFIDPNKTAKEYGCEELETI